MAGENLEATTIGALLARDGGSVKTGPFGTTLKAKEYSKKGVPLISVGEVGYGSLQIHESTPRAPREVVERLPEYVLQKGDIVFGRKGAVDRSAMVKTEQAGWFLGSDGIRLRLPGTCDARFIAYQLQSCRARSWLLQHATGTTMASLNQSTIERLPITLPPLPEQRAIAHILGTLDDKIELNRRMSETLEAMARALFKSWFVDFDPVRAKAEGVFPAGWSRKRWGDIATLEYGKSIRDYRESSGQYRVFGTNGPIGFHDEALCNSEGIIIGRKGAYRGIHFSPEPFFVIDTAFYLQPKSALDLKWAYYELLRFDINSMDSGSAIPSTSRDDFYGIPVIVPPTEIQAAFGKIVNGWFAKIRANADESRTLAALRDTLLPKLISGELRIAEPKRFLKEVAP